MKTFIKSLPLSIMIFFASTAFAGNVSDSVITGKVESKIALDNSLSVFDVDVSTHRGVVKLVGTVDSDDQASNLIEIASATDGVRDVDAKKLLVKESNHPFRDTMITAKVKGAFVREKLFGEEDVTPMTISVETKNGIVYLSGNVENKRQLSRAIEIAKEVEGVRTVRSHVDVG